MRVKPVLASLVLSILVSAAATAVARRLFQAGGGLPRPGEASRQGQFAPNIVVVWMPVLVGNSGNTFGKPQDGRGRFGRRRRR